MVFVADSLSLIKRGYNPWIASGKKPEEVTPEDFASVYSRANDRTRAGMFQLINKMKLIPRETKLEYLMHALVNDESLMVLNAACDAVDEDSKHGKSILGYRVYYDWCHVELTKLNPESNFIKSALPPFATPNSDPDV